MSERMELLDRALGELLPGMPLVVTGPVGAGRTVLCLQIAADALAKQHDVVYVTTAPHAILLQQAESLGLPLRRAVLEERLILLELEPHAPMLVQAEGAHALLQAIAAEGAAHTLIWDPINTLLAEFIDESALRAALGGLLAGPTATPQVVVATAETSQLEQQPLIWRGLSDLCGALVELERRDHGDRALKVVKTRFGGAVGTFPYEIGPSGLIPTTESPEPGEAVERDAEPAQPVVAAPAPAPRSRPAPAPDAAPPPGNGRILIVDRNDHDRETVAGWLSEYDVVQASTAFEALAEVVRERPQLVVIDPNLEDGAGRELVATLRSGALRVPVLVQSGRAARQADRIGLLVMGAADVLPKPPNRFELRRKVDTLMRLAPEEPGPDAGPPVIELLTSKRRKVSVAEMRERIERAWEFGESYGIPSSVAALEADWSEGRDALVAAAEASLRAEDALLLQGDRRVVLLLVAASLEQAELVVGRIAANAQDKQGEPFPFAAHYAPVDKNSARTAWKELFRDSDDAEEES